MGVHDEEFGQRLKAFVVLRDGGHAGRGGGAGVREGEPRPLQGPARVVFVEELPRNATGKVLKRELSTRGRSRLAGRG